MTEYIELLSIKTLSLVAKAIAPPEPPSPITTEIHGASQFKATFIDCAIASA